jgi:hypothetical protein
VTRRDVFLLAQYFGNTTQTSNIPKGEYWFKGLEAGDYTVREVVPMGYVQTAPVGGAHTVSISPGSSVGNLNFGNIREGEIHGTKFVDANGNGVRNVGEAGLGGVTVYLDLDNDGVLDANEPRTTTASGILGDVNNDGVVGIGDLGVMQSNMGSCDVGMDQGDLNGDGCVTRRDVFLLAQYFGNTTQTSNIRRR